MRIALIGSPKYENRGEIKELVWKLKQKFGEELILITRGNKDGIEKWVRKFALEMGVKYIEYNPASSTSLLHECDIEAQKILLRHCRFQENRRGIWFHQ